MVATSYPADASAAGAAGSVAASGGPSGDRAAIVRCPDGVVHLFLCDVAGNGGTPDEPASFLLDAARFAICQQMSLPAVMDTLNLALAHYYREGVVFASAFLAAFTGDAVYAVSAGHPDALLFSADGSSHRHVAATGPLLGLLASARYNAAALPFAAGETLVVASDGITDARRRRRVPESGLGRFAKPIAAVLGANAPDPARGIVRRLIGEGYRFRGDYALATLRRSA